MRTACARGGHALLRRQGSGDLPCQPQEIGGANELEHRKQRGPCVEQADQADTDHEDHQRKADRDTGHVRQGAADPEVRARCHQHHVIRPWRDRGNKGEADKGDELLRIHVSILLQFIGKYVANKAINIVIGAIHVQT